MYNTLVEKLEARIKLNQSLIEVETDSEIKHDLEIETTTLEMVLMLLEEEKWVNLTQQDL